jgi:hypothetical protein
MNVRTRTPGAAALLALAMATPGAQAQSTDGYHAYQVFPLVVDTASFTQRFDLQGADPWGYDSVEPTFYPAQGTAQATPVGCPSFTPPSDGEMRFASLRDLCPGLPPGSMFGTLVLRSGMLFSGTSRVSNPAGAGFIVEAFPAHTFTSAQTSVTGLRRLTAVAGQPAFQTNCFVGNLGAEAPGSTSTATVLLTLHDAGGTALGSTNVSVAPGQIVRLLDVFAAAHVAPGNVDDATASFVVQDDTGAGLLSFCTVQDNTSYGADFRIGKQQYALNDGVGGPRDRTASRFTRIYTEEPIDAETAGAELAIPPGASRNIHLFYFRHPDRIGCALVNSAGGVIPASHGLEMRLRVHDPDGWSVVAGGNDVQLFPNVYLGDKPHHGDGANTTYQLEVESSGINEGVARPYGVWCYSGSGHTRGELLRKGLPPAF